MYRFFFKRILDFFCSLSSLILLFPFFIILTPIVALKMHGTPFFVQPRPGKKCKIFKMIKYRTMTNEKDAFGKLLPDDKRLTKFGKFLRRTSIDELPELFNILMGHMSFVGPRPQLVKDMVFFDSEIMKRQSIRPGLTGLAQVSGRNLLNWDKKFEYDLLYIKKITFLKDIKMIFLTILKVLKKEGINEPSMETAMDYGEYLLKIGRIDEKYFNEMLGRS